MRKKCKHPGIRTNGDMNASAITCCFSVPELSSSAEDVDPNNCHTMVVLCFPTVLVKASIYLCRHHSISLVSRRIFVNERWPRFCFPAASHFNNNNRRCFFPARVFDVAVFAPLLRLLLVQFRCLQPSARGTDSAYGCGHHAGAPRADVVGGSEGELSIIDVWYLACVELCRVWY